MLATAAILAAVPPAAAQLNTNLIVNGDAEAGPAGSGVTAAVSSIPGWTVQSGKPTVLPYNLTITAPPTTYKRLYPAYRPRTA